jgi:hypothetical protein
MSLVESDAPTDQSAVSAMSEPSPYALIVADFIQIGFVAAALAWLLLANTEASLTWRIIVTGGMVIAVWRSLAWLVLLAIQLNSFLREPPQPNTYPGFDTAVACVVVLLLLAYTCSFHTTRRQLQFLLAKLLDWFVDPSGARKRLALEDSSARDKPTFDVQTFMLTVRGFKMVAVVLISMILFGTLPILPGAREEWWQRSMANGLTLWPGPALFLVGVACVVLFSQSEWRQISPAQARLYLRSVFVQFHYRDLRMILLRRQKAARAKGTAQQRREEKRMAAIAPLAKATLSNKTNEPGA